VRVKLWRGHIIKGRFAVNAPALFLPALLLLFAACGYRMAGQTTAVPESIKSIAITVFENESYEPDIETTVTREVTRKFIEDGRLRVVTEEKADAVLSGKVTNYRLETVATDQFGYTTRYEITVTVSIQFKDNSGSGYDKSLVITAKSSFGLGEKIVAAESARQKAIIAVSKIIGDNIIGRILEGF